MRKDLFPGNKKHRRSENVIRAAMPYLECRETHRQALIGVVTFALTVGVTCATSLCTRRRSGCRRDSRGHRLARCEHDVEAQHPPALVYPSAESASVRSVLRRRSSNPSGRIDVADRASRPRGTPYASGRRDVLRQSRRVGGRVVGDRDGQRRDALRRDRPHRPRTSPMRPTCRPSGSSPSSSRCRR